MGKKIMGYTVKAVKSFVGREGYGFSCSLWLDGKRIGTVTDTAGGGMVDFYLNQGEKEKLDAHCRTLSQARKPSTMMPKGIDTDCDIFVTNLVEAVEQDQARKKQKAQVKRWCKTQTVYRLKGDKEGSYRIVTTVYSAGVKKYLEAKYPNLGLDIMNEKV